jgi:hypothetical protein
MCSAHHAAATAHCSKQHNHTHAGGISQAEFCTHAAACRRLQSLNKHNSNKWMHSSAACPGNFENHQIQIQTAAAVLHHGIDTHSVTASMHNSLVVCKGSWNGRGSCLPAEETQAVCMVNVINARSTEGTVFAKQHKTNGDKQQSQQPHGAK